MGWYSFSISYLETTRYVLGSTQRARKRQQIWNLWKIEMGFLFWFWFSEKEEDLSSFYLEIGFKDEALKIMEFNKEREKSIYKEGRDLIDTIRETQLHRRFRLLVDVGFSLSLDFYFIFCSLFALSFINGDAEVFILCDIDQLVSLGMRIWSSLGCPSKRFYGSLHLHRSFGFNWVKEPSDRWLGPFG